MNVKQRRRRHERRLHHQTQQTKSKSERGPVATAPTKPRRRALPKRAVRAMGRKLRPDRNQWWK